MPIYTYRCQNCGNEFELRQRMSDSPVTECPRCQGAVRRVVNSVGIVFKGNGFYITDSRHGQANGSANGKGDSRSPKKEKETAASTTDSSTASKAPVEKGTSASA